MRGAMVHQTRGNVPAHDGGLRGHGVRRRPAPERAGLWDAAVPDGSRPLAHLRPDERREPRARLVLHAGRVLRAFDLPVHRQLLARAGARADSGRRDRNRDGARVHAAALPPRPHGPGAADLRLHLRVLRPGAGGVGPRDRAAAGAGDPPGRHPDRARRVLDLPAVPDRARLCDGAAAVAVPRPQPHRRHGARRRRRRRHGGGARRQYPAPVHRHLRRRRGAGRARRRRGWPRARALSRHGYRNSHPRLHRHRHRRDGKPARRLRRQPADRRDRYLRQGLFPEPRAVPDLSGDGGGAAGAAAGPVRHQVYRRVRPRPRSPP